MVWQLQNKKFVPPPLLPKRVLLQSPRKKRTGEWMIHLVTEPWSQDDHPTTESSHDIKVITEPLQPSQVITQEQDSTNTIQTKTSHVKKKRCKPAPLKNDDDISRHPKQRQKSTTMSEQTSHGNYGSLRIK